VERLAGLHDTVEVLRDARGVPHLRARSLDDLFLAQGYVTAQDRLWQMDLSRRLARGELSEIFGESMLRLDEENRTLGFSQAARRGVEELDAEKRRLLQAYAGGVNEFIARHRHRLPIEFTLVGYQPRPWQTADSLGVALNMVKVLNTTWPSDLMRERVRAKVPPELYADLFPYQSDLDHPVAELVRATSGRGEHVRTQAPPHAEGPKRTFAVSTSGGHPSTSGHASTSPRTRRCRASLSVPEQGRREDSEPFGSAQGPEGLEGRQSNRRPPLQPPHAEGLEWAFAELGLATQEFQADLGSNNWVVSGAHTQSGKPLLANDPHLAHSIPSVWYMAHLTAPGLDVTGVSLPGLPLVIIEHNERIAWGMTNTGPDVQDLYAESFNFRDPNKYLHNGEWVDAEVRSETVRVRGGADFSFTIKTTRHGPVVSHDGGRDLALQWTALQPHALRFPFLEINRAHDWREFTEALREFTAPMQNFVYADESGNIGYYAAGWVPLRKQGDGTVPVSGSTDDYDWTGFIPFEDLPHAYNPAGGIIATANGRIVPDGYPYLITREWAAAFRTARIYELLQSGNRLDVSGMLRIQTDIVTLEDLWLAKQLVSAAGTAPPSSPDARYALSLLRNWDGEAQADSAATLVCEMTRHALLNRILKPKLGEDLAGYHWPMSSVFIENVLSQHWPRWLPPGDADFNQTLMKSLEAGVAGIAERVGSHDHAAWQWGSTIPLTFRNRLSFAFPFLGRFLNVGPVPQAGTGATVKQTTPNVGPSMRMVVDFSDFDRSVQNITLGESGQIFSPYYRDQFDAWYHGRSFPMLSSEEAVRKGAMHRLVLEPTSAP
jgi:penicillin amidase